MDELTAVATRDILGGAFLDLGVGWPTRTADSGAAEVVSPD